MPREWPAVHQAICELWRPSAQGCQNSPASLSFIANFPPKKYISCILWFWCVCVRAVRVMWAIPRTIWRLEISGWCQSPAADTVIVSSRTEPHGSATPALAGRHFSPFQGFKWSHSSNHPLSVSLYIEPVPLLPRLSMCFAKYTELCFLYPSGKACELIGNLGSLHHVDFPVKMHQAEFCVSVS